MREIIGNIFFAIIISYALAFALSIFCIKYLKGINTKIKPELYDVHSQKEGTPNIGGIAFISATMIYSFIFIPLNKNILFVLFSTFLFSLLGFVDDMSKIKTKNGDGISPKLKMIIQFILGLIIAIIGEKFSTINLGFSLLYNEGGVYYLIRIAIISFLITYFSNAFNITDGIDGLLASVSIPIFGLIFLIGLSMPERFSTILISISMLSSLLAFLHFNRHPSIYFMGDCGSMGLGVFLISIAFVLNIVPVFFIATLVISVELFSSLIQIIAIRKFKKKVFTIAPIHHAFQKKGLREEYIVSLFTRYSIISSILAFFVYSMINN